MANWTSITEDNLKASQYGSYIDAAEAQAGAIDPVAECIADAVSKVRAACSQGNSLDADPTKVPNSLKGLTVRLAIYALMGRISAELTQDQRDDKKNDQSYLMRIMDNGLRFEQADTPAGGAEMQQGAAIDTVEFGNFGNDRRELRGL